MAAVTTTVLAALAAASTAAAVGATLMQGAAANDAAKAQAKTIRAEQNNKQLEFIEQMKRERLKSKRALATIRTRLAQTGTDTTAGTPLAILGENAGNIELGFQDAARSQMIQDQSMSGAAAMARFEGKQARTSSYISAGGQLLQSAASMGSDYLSMVHTGALKDTFQIYKPKPRPF
jgi:hypothetical protein